MIEYRYLLAIDPSLTCSGWALFHIRDGSIISVGTIRGAPPKVALANRLSKIQTTIEMLLEKVNLGERDVLVCEAPTTVRDPHNALKVEQVRSMFETTARARGVAVPGRINPRTVQHEIMGLQGRQRPRVEVKQTALRIAEFLFPAALTRLGLMEQGRVSPRHQDIVDALLIGKLALVRIQSAEDGKVPLESVFLGVGQRSRKTWRVKACGL